MENEKNILILVATCIFIIFFFFQYRKNVARRRSKEMAFLRVVMSRKDSDTDEKQDTIKDFREQISLMEQLLSGLKSLYRGNFW